MFANSSRRVSARSARAFSPISSNVIVDGSVRCCCQIAFGSSPRESFRIITSFAKPSCQDILDPVNPHCYICGRQSGDLTDGYRIHVFRMTARWWGANCGELAIAGGWSTSTLARKAAADSSSLRSSECQRNCGDGGLDWGLLHGPFPGNHLASGTKSPPKFRHDFQRGHLVGPGVLSRPGATSASATDYLGSCVESQPPPRARTRPTLAAKRRVSMSMAVRWFWSSAASAVSTSR